jgi:hypothetical protein
MMQISNPGPGFLKRLFNIGPGGDASASILFSGVTSSTANTSTTHVISASIGTVCVRNHGSAAISASDDRGANYSSIGAGESFITTNLDRRSILVKSASVNVAYDILGAGDTYSLPSSIKVGADEDADFVTITDAFINVASGSNIALQNGIFIAFPDASGDATITFAGTGSTNCIVDDDVTLAATGQARGFYVALGHTITVGSQTFTTTGLTLIDEVMKFFFTGIIKVPSTLASNPNDAMAAAVAGNSVWVLKGDFGNVVCKAGVNLLGAGPNPDDVIIGELIEEAFNCSIQAANDCYIGNLTVRQARPAPQTINDCDSETDWVWGNDVSHAVDTGETGITCLALSSLPNNGLIARFPLSEAVNESTWFVRLKPSVDVATGLITVVISTAADGSGTTQTFACPAMAADVWYEWRMPFTAMDALSISFNTTGDASGLTLKVDAIKAHYVCNCANGIYLQGVTGGSVIIDNVKFDAEDSAVIIGNGTPDLLHIRNCYGKTTWQGFIVSNALLENVRLDYDWNQYTSDEPRMLQGVNNTLRNTHLYAELPAGYGIPNGLAIGHYVDGSIGSSNDKIYDSTIVASAADPKSTTIVAAGKYDDEANTIEVLYSNTRLSAATANSGGSAYHFYFTDYIFGSVIELGNCTLPEPLSTDESDFLFGDPAQMYVDSSDGDLKCIFEDGFVATLAADS